ncbi:MAG: hypothetical protein ACI81R_002556 [Bradymonadia bacterium]
MLRYKSVVRSKTESAARCLHTKVRMINRATVIQAIRTSLRETAEVAKAQGRAAQDEATNDETKQESKYDTRAIEAAYLAQAQGGRLAETERALGIFEQLSSDGSRDRVDGPCYCELLTEEGVRHYFIGPVAGGLKVEVAGERVLVITPASPLGKSLLGCEPDDELASGALLVRVE